MTRTVTIRVRTLSLCFVLMWIVLAALAVCVWNLSARIEQFEQREPTIERRDHSGRER